MIGGKESITILQPRGYNEREVIEYDWNHRRPIS